MTRTRFNVQRVIGFLLGGAFFYFAVIQPDRWIAVTITILIALNVLSAFISITYKGKDL